MRERRDERHWVKATALILGALTALIGTTQTQEGREFSIASSLGYGGTVSPLVPLNDSTVVAISPSTHASLSPVDPRLVLIYDLHVGGFIQDIPYPFSGGLLQIWNEPLRLDDQTVLLPSAGADGRFGSPDDEMVLFESLNHPVGAFPT